MLKTLEGQFPDAAPLELTDESHGHNVPKGSESHFKLLLVSKSFTGVKRVQRQRQLLDLFADELNSGLHALSMRLLTPEEWSQQNSTFQSPPCASKIKK